jgi:hypothetical protein
MKESNLSNDTINQNQKGRPKLSFDMKLVQNLGQIGATYEEMALFFQCSIETIKNKMKDEFGDFCMSYKKGKAALCQSLRRRQIEIALDKTNKSCTSMLIWLGKNILGQSDQGIANLDTKLDESINEETRRKVLQELHEDFQNLSNTVPQSPPDTSNHP